MIKNVMTSVYTRNGEENSFSFYTSLRASDKVTFVNSVVDMLVDVNYNSVIRDLIFDFMIINMFTDIDTSDITKPDNQNAINMIEDLLHETNIVDVVKANVEIGLIEELNKAVDDNIEYRTGIHRNPISESLSRILDTLEKKLSNININSEELMKVSKIFNNIQGELTMDKMIEAYTNSNMFKQKYDKMVEDKEKHISDIEAIASEIK